MVCNVLNNGITQFTPFKVKKLYIIMWLFIHSVYLPNLRLSALFDGMSGMSPGSPSSRSAEFRKAIMALTLLYLGGMLLGAQQWVNSRPVHTYHMPSLLLRRSLQ